MWRLMKFVVEYKEVCIGATTGIVMICFWCTMKGMQFFRKRKQEKRTASSVVADVKTMIDEAKSRLHKDGEIFVKYQLESSKKRLERIMSEVDSYETVSEDFNRAQAKHYHALRGFANTFEQAAASLTSQHVQMGTEESRHIYELQEASEERIMKFEESR